MPCPLQPYRARAPSQADGASICHASPSPAQARRRGGVAASFVTGALFGLLHMADPVAVPPLMLMGVVLGELRRRGASLWPCIAAHALNNVLAVLLALA